MLNRDRGRYKPPSDIITTDDRFIILVEIANMSVDDFKLSLLNHKLVISGMRELPNIKGNTSYQQVEIETGEFRLEYVLNQPVNSGQVTANYHNGLLHVELPFVEKKTVTVVMANEEKED